MELNDQIRDQIGTTMTMPLYVFIVREDEVRFMSVSKVLIGGNHGVPPRRVN